MQKLTAGQEHAEDWDGKDKMLNIGQYTRIPPPPPTESWGLTSSVSLCVTFSMNYSEKSFVVFANFFWRPHFSNFKWVHSSSYTTPYGHHLDQLVLQRTGLKTRNLWSLSSFFPQNFQEYLGEERHYVWSIFPSSFTQNSIETIELLHYSSVFVTL